MKRLLLIPVLIFAACAERRVDAPTMVSIQADIEAALPGVDHMTSARLDRMAPGEVVLFDVRAEEEFAVSHLPGAIRVDPGMAADAFLAAHGEELTGRTAVFYCSVGWRSSSLAARLTQPLAAQNTRAVNLRGGAFAWTNEGRLLERRGQPTNEVHPYDAEWGRLITDEAARVQMPFAP